METLGLLAILVFGSALVIAEEIIFRRIRSEHPDVWEELGRPQMRGLPITRRQRKLNKFLDDPESLEALNDRVILFWDSVRAVARFFLLLAVIALLAQKFCRPGF